MTIGIGRGVGRGEGGGGQRKVGGGGHVSPNNFRGRGTYVLAFF